MNKRPLPCVLAGFVLGEVWMLQFHGTAALAALYLAPILFIIVGVKKKGSLFILLSIGIIIGGFRQNQWQGYKDLLSQWKEQDSVLIAGQMEDLYKKESSCSLLLNHLTIEGEKCGGRLLVYLEEEPDWTIGSRILLKGRIEDFELPTNPGGFHQRQYREGTGVLGVVKNAKITEVRLGSFLIKDGIYEIRQRSAEYMLLNMKEELAGTGIAMAFGDKSYLEEEQKQLYELAGISHVLAVSGLHMSLLGAALYKILRKLGFPYSVSVVCSIPCILLYAVMTGLSSSCFRAAIMLLIYLIGEWKGYYYDLPSAMSFAGMWLLYEIPSRLFDSSFLLSFSAIFSVGIICPFLFSIFHYETGRKKIRDSFLSGLVITVFTIPLSLYYFYGFSFAGLILNLIVIPLMSVLVPLLFLVALGWMPWIPDVIDKVCFSLSELILNLYTLLCESAADFSFLYMQAGYRSVLFAVAYYLILCLLISFIYIRYRKKKKINMLYFLLSFVILMSFLYSTGRKDSFITILDVGQGDGILYHSGKGEVCMIDGGSTSEKKIGRYVLRPALEYYGCSKVDYWFLSHMDEDHISGVKELLENGYPIRNLILPVRKNLSEKQQEIESLAKKNNTKIHYMKQGDKVVLKESTFYCLYPKKNPIIEDENQNSLVLLLDTKNQQILLTGDAEKEGEEKMTEYLNKFNLDFSKEQILKVGHHGSSNGTKEPLLHSFQPDSAVISCGIDNSYGHPDIETIDRIKKIHAHIYYTMKQGAIEIRLGKETSYFGYGVIR